MRTYLVWLVIASLLPGVIGAAALVIGEYRNSRQDLERNTIQTARALVQAIDTHLLRVETLAETVASSEALMRGDLPAFHQEARRVMAAVGLGTNIVLRDETGHQILNTHVEFNIPLDVPPALDRVKQIFSTGKPSYSDLVFGPVIKRLVINVDMPVFIDDKVKYVLSVGILPKNFQEVLAAQGLPQGWIAVVFDRTDNIVARTHEPETYVGHTIVTDLQDLLHKQQEGSGVYLTREGLDVLSFYSRSPNTGMGVAIGVPRASVEGVFIKTMLMATVSMLLLLGISVLLARHMSARIIRAVHALTAPAAALGEERVLPIPEVAIKEVNDVAGAIGRAARLLQERSASLHARQTELLEIHRLARFGTWSWNAHTGVLAVSASVQEILGRELPTFLEMRDTLLDADTWEALNLAARKAFRAGTSFVMELPVSPGIGGPMWIDCRGEAVRRGRHMIGLRGTVQDITTRKREEQKRREIEQELRQFKFFSDNANDGMLLFDADGQIRYANKLICEHLRYNEEELLRLKSMDVDPLHSLDRFRELFARSRQGRIRPFESQYRRRDGTMFPVEITVTVLEVKDEWLMFAVSRDISERKLSENAIRDAALHDILTGLPNRALVMNYCERALAAARREHSHGALLFIDLDRFKPINDLYGHETGDRVLQEVSRRLKSCTREEDLVGRLGGDEFVIVLPYIDTGRHRAATVAQHVIVAINKPFLINGLELSLSPSIGISYFLEHANNVSDLIHTADMAMYQAKQSGRGHYRFYTPDLDAKAQHALKIEMRLKQALNDGEFALHYQPVVEVASGRLVGAEALLRLRGPGGETEPIGPDQFIPIAESAGLISELGDWVLIEACRQQATWHNQGMTLKIAINISPLQFRQRRFAERLRYIIMQSGIDPSFLEIELTESAVMADVGEAVAILERVKLLGVRVALDDFGTAYSNLGSLTSLPVDKLKVDQSFIRRIERDAASRAVTDAIIALARSLQMEVVGEGIESEHTLQYLLERGCDLAQGFWFSKPLSPADFKQWRNAREEMRTSEREPTN